MTPKPSARPSPSAFVRTDLACESSVPAASVEEKTISTATRPVTDRKSVV